MLQLDNLRNLLLEAINELKFDQKPTELYEPITYMMQLGGKRMRPLLTLLGYYLFDNQVEKALQPALAVEIFHNFTLMHDDIMDKAPLRRGKLTVHEKWNESVAILSGDVMLVKAYENLIHVEDKYLRLIIQKFNQCAAEVCEGQQSDMNFESCDTVSEDDYIEMIRLKTAVLLGFALATGAILAGASTENVALLEKFGVYLGIGFQLKDDLLDVYADATKFGKQVGGDIMANKKTFLLIKSLELAKNTTQEKLNHWLSVKNFDKDEKVKAVMDIYNELNIKQLTEDKMNIFFAQAFGYLEKLHIAPDKKQLLEQFTQYLIERDS